MEKTNNKIVIIGTVDEDVYSILNEGGWNWSNFEKGDTVYIESFSPNNLPNLEFIGISDTGEVVLSAI